MARKKTKSASMASRTPSIPKPKPTQELIEIDSEEEERSRPPRLSGPLRGLNPGNVLSTTQPTVEISDDDESPEPKEKHENKHETRASRNGRSLVSYDMKYHPMDEVTRPKRAAKRRSGSRSLSASLMGHDRSETPEDSLPSSARGSNSDESEDSEAESIEFTERKPDPRASRHSIRQETTRAINYSSKHHPQDRWLPGFQHKARKANLKVARHSEESKSTTGGRKRSVENLDSGLESEDDQESGQPSQSHKRPKVHGDNRESGRKSSKPKTKRRKVDKQESEDTNDLAEEAIAASQFRTTTAIGSDSLPRFSNFYQTQDALNDDESDGDPFSNPADEDAVPDCERLARQFDSNVGDQAVPSDIDDRSGSYTDSDDASPAVTTMAPLVSKRNARTTLEPLENEDDSDDASLTNGTPARPPKGRRHDISASALPTNPLQSSGQGPSTSTAVEEQPSPVIISSGEPTSSSESGSTEVPELRNARPGPDLQAERDADANNFNRDELIEPNHKTPRRRQSDEQSKGDNHELVSEFDEQFSITDSRRLTGEIGETSEARRHTAEQYPSPVTNFTHTPQANDGGTKSLSAPDVSKNINHNLSQSHDSSRGGEKTNGGSPVQDGSVDAHDELLQEASMSDAWFPPDMNGSQMATD